MFRLGMLEFPQGQVGGGREGWECSDVFPVGGPGHKSSLCLLLGLFSLDLVSTCDFVDCSPSEEAPKAKIRSMEDLVKRTVC